MQMSANLEDLFLLRICPWMQIYPILYKPQYNPKSELKTSPLTYKQQLPECISLPQRYKRARQKRPRQKITIQRNSACASIKRWLMTSSLKNENFVLALSSANGSVSAVLQKSACAWLSAMLDWGAVSRLHAIRKTKPFILSKAYRI